MHLYQTTQTPTTTQLLAIPNGPPGTRQTLKLMRRFVIEGKKYYPLRKLALSIVRRNGNKDYIGEVKSISSWVKRNIRYVKDIRGIETIQTPQKTLEIGQGDCDDHSVLVSTLLECIGHMTRFVAIGFMPGTFQHVYTETKLGPKSKNMWIAVETTEPWPVGKAAKNPVEKMIVHI